MMKKQMVVACMLFLFPQISIAAEAEEPDYAFITGGPYTQGKDVVQFIQANNLSNTHSAGTVVRDLTSSLRTEWGFTDKLEADLIVLLRNQWTRARGTTIDLHDIGDTVFGMRYRFLSEESFPLTVTFGPQIIIPTGNESKGFSSGKIGVAWDLSLAREWNKWFFHYASLNYSTTPGVTDPTAGSATEFILHNLTWAVAPAFRVLEKDSTAGAHHDIHLFLEGGGTIGQSVNAGTAVGNKITTSTYVIAPGVRYGYLSKTESLAEIGVSVPTGLNDNTPDWGIILQAQFEYPF